MIDKTVPIIHVDGSLMEYMDNKKQLHRIAGCGGYLVVKGKIADTFKKTMKNIPFLNYHEEYAIIEALKWARHKKYDSIKIKTDCMSAISLFTNKKKSLNKADKFFMVQFLMLEMGFESIELVYHKRCNEDLSHLLSRAYMDKLPSDIVKINQHDDHAICEIGKINQINNNEKEVKKRLFSHVKEFELLL
jgi:ribonuclease HI